MKLYVRLLLTFPFVIVVFGYYKFVDPDQDCHGLVDLIINFVFYAFILLTGIFAFVGTLRIRQSERLKFEPFTFFVTLFTFLFLIYNFTLRGHTKGNKWIYAQSKDSNVLPLIQDLTLRKNENFTVNLNNIDFGCSISGSYKRSGDTIIFNKETINKTDERMTTLYLIKENELIPLFDTTNKRTFKIIKTK